jgi:hypothetical protein
MTRTALALAVAVLAVACDDGGSSSGGDGGASAPGSCAHGKNSCSPGTEFCCADYGGSFTAAEVQSDCQNPRVMGEYSPDPCTTEHLEASCTLYRGTAAEKTIRYYEGYDALSQSDPATNCSALHGFFEEAPP